MLEDELHTRGHTSNVQFLMHARYQENLHIHEHEKLPTGRVYRYSSSVEDHGLTHLSLLRSFSLTHEEKSVLNILPFRILLI